MLIVYCDACGLRILQKDMDSGGGVQLDENRFLCAKCAPAQKAKAPSGAVPAPAARETPGGSRAPTGEIRQSKTATLRTLPRPSDKSSGAVAASGSASTARRAAIPPADAPKPKSLMLPMLAGGAGLLVFLVGIWFALSGKSSDSARITDAGKPDAPASPPAQPASLPEAAMKRADTAPAAGEDEGKRRALPSWMQTGKDGDKGGLRGAEQKTAPVELRKGAAAEEPKKISAIAEAQKKENDNVIFSDDGPPIGATLDGSLKEASWKWVQKPDPVYSGSYAHTFSGGPADGNRQHTFNNSSAGLKINPNDVLFAYVYIDPKSPPKSIMMQWHYNKSWEHRAYWGDDAIPFGQNFSPSRLPMGPLPKAGEWVRLEVPAAQIGVDAETQITGLSFDQAGGTVYWDRAGAQLMPATVAVADPNKDAPPVPPTPPAPPEAGKPAAAGQLALAIAGEAAAPVKLLWKEFKGGQEYPNDFAGADKRPSKAIWGKHAPRAKLTASFTMGPGDYSTGVLKVTSCRHGSPNPCLIAFTINGQEIYNGKDKSKSGGMRWGDQDYEIPSGVLKAGANELVILNMEDTNYEHREPWYMINSVEIRATLNPEKAFAPIVSEAQRSKLQLYEKALEALAKKDSEVLLKLEGVLKLVKTAAPAAANVFAAAETKDSAVELPLAAGVERAQDLYAKALDAFRKKPPTEPIAVEKLKTSGAITRIDGNKVFVKAGGIELSVDIASIPRTVIYKALAIDESKPAGLNDKAAWLLGLGQLDDVQLVLKKVPKDARPAWAAFFADYAGLDKLIKFEAALINAQQQLAHGKTDTALILLNGVKKDYPEFLDANQERMAFLIKRLEGLQKK